MKLKDKRIAYEKYRKLHMILKLEGDTSFEFIRKLIEGVQKIVGKGNVTEIWQYIDIRDSQDANSLHRKTGFSKLVDKLNRISD